MAEELLELTNSLIKVSPYLAIMVLFAVGFIVMFNKAIKAQKELTQTAITQMRENTDTVIKELKSAYKNRS